MNELTPVELDRLRRAAIDVTYPVVVKRELLILLEAYAERDALRKELDVLDVLRRQQ